MKKYATRGVLEVMFYLMALNGNDYAEIEAFDKFGKALDGDKYEAYKGQMFEECVSQISDYNVKYKYDLVSEGVDASLRKECEKGDKGITARQLIWYMLGIAHSDKNYDENERRLIAHVQRITGVPYDALTSLEYIMETASAIKRDLDWINYYAYIPAEEMRYEESMAEGRLALVMKAAHEIINEE